MARPSKLTPQVQQRIVSAISAGNYLEQAATYGGVTYQSLRNWLLRGEHAQHGPYFEFFKAVTRAEVEAEIASVTQLKAAGSEDWRAALAFLERRYPDRWGRKDRATIEHMLSREAKQAAADLGLDEDLILADAERILSRSH